MSPTTLAAVLLVLASAGYVLGRGRAVATAGGKVSALHSVPQYYGLNLAIWCAVPALILLVAWIALERSVIDWIVVGALPEGLTAGKSDAQMSLLLSDIHSIARGTIASRSPDPALLAAAADYNRLSAISHWLLFAGGLSLAVAGLGLGWSRIAPTLRARNEVERFVSAFLVVCSLIAIFTTLGIVLSLIFESLRFFRQVPPLDFLFGLHWSPQTAIRADQVGSSGAFGAVPIFAGTLLISAIAMAIAVPVGLLSAIYMADYAPKRVRAFVKPMLEILAGIPTVVYGFFAVLTVAPIIRDAGAAVGIPVSANSALAAGLVMGIMIIPFVSSLSDDVINAVPQSLRDGSAALGATRSETIRKVVLPAALPGIVGAVLLAVSRAIGETMIVVMAAGLAANLTANPFAAVTTVTVQIVTLLVGDQEFDSAKTLAAFALGLVLFMVTLALNVVALRVVRKYREKYD